ncbi:MAG: hypothetical protein J5780_04950 [Treponema sp.]|nr:hypothetical protein [Treponema sp.]
MSANNAEEFTNFDRMASGIPDHERKAILSKVRNNSSDSQEKITIREEKENIKLSLAQHLQQEGFFTRLWIKIKSAFLGVPVEDLYNSSVVSRIAHEIERNFPGLIDWDRSVLTSNFYEKLLQLKNIQMFFKKYIDFYSKNAGRFYFYMGRFMMGELSDKALADSDPYQYPFTKNLSKETRLSLLQKLDSVLDTIPEEVRSQMYSCVRSIEWLSAFTRLYLDGFINSFSENGKECNFTMARTDFSQFSKIMNVSNIPDSETIQALHSFWKDENASDENTSSFTVHAENELAGITAFSQMVPVKDVAKVVFENSLYDPGIYSGGEDWYVKFRTQWKIKFDSRWASWMTDYKKYRLKIKMRNYYDAQELPVFPVRPWTELWGNVVFKQDLALGFMWYFFMKLLPSFFDVLKTVMLEGDFAIKENAIEFTDDINIMRQVTTSLEELRKDLLPEGIMGIEFGKLKGKPVFKKSVKESIDVLMDDLSNRTSVMIDQFGAICRSLKPILDAVVNGAESEAYGPLTNFMKIRGRENKFFRENLAIAAANFEHGYELLLESEVIDSPSDS